MMVGMSIEPTRPTELPVVGRVARAEPLVGGDISTTWLVTTAGGERVVVKTSEAAPPDLYPVEADGLAAIGATGAIVTPRVRHVDAHCLILQALAPHAPDDPDFWPAAGRALATLHRTHGPRFGWHRDGFLGRLPQTNGWHDDGHAFYAEHRLLRYLPEPGVAAHLDRTWRTAVERLCDRLPELVPPMPPSLTHGDLAPLNVIATDTGTPALIDPAASYTWAEVDVSMIWCLRAGRVPVSFFAAYHEVSPLRTGWRDRALLIHLREMLSLLAHFPDRASVREWVLPRVEEVLRPHR